MIILSVINTMAILGTTYLCSLVCVGLVPHSPKLKGPQLLAGLKEYPEEPGAGRSFILCSSSICCPYWRLILDTLAVITHTLIGFILFNQTCSTLLLLFTAILPKITGQLLLVFTKTFTSTKVILFT